jgi:hypothetical protein
MAWNERRRPWQNSARGVNASRNNQQLAESRQNRQSSGNQ